MNIWWRRLAVGWFLLSLGLVSCTAEGEMVPEVSVPTAVSQITATAIPTHTHTPNPPTATATATQTPTATIPPTETPIPLTPTPDFEIYTVQYGDTLYGLAETYGLTIDELSEANSLTDANVLSEGDSLRIPLPTPTPEPTSTIDPDAQPTETPSPTPPPDGPPTTLNGLAYAEFVIMPPEVVANVQAIYERGQTEHGRDPNHFSKLGDSTSLNPHFLARFGNAPYKLGDYDYLQPTIDHYQTAFANYGVALRNGLHSWNVFDPFWANKNWCEPNEDVLTCEFRLNNPSVLFIRLGSNDAGASFLFNQNMRQVVEFAIENGVVPIMATKADRFEGSNENNEMLRQIALDYQIPIWDFDRVSETLPSRGLGDDNIHIAITDHPHDFTDPTTFQIGHPVQDLSALIMLDELRRILE